jgi:hypothetical protein
MKFRIKYFDTRWISNQNAKQAGGTKFNMIFPEDRHVIRRFVRKAASLFCLSPRTLLSRQNGTDEKVT